MLLRHRLVRKNNSSFSNKIKNKEFIKRKFIRISYTLNLQYIQIVKITTLSPPAYVNRNIII